jgi:DNA 3'-phosphatase
MYKVKETFEYLVNDPNNFCSVHDALEMDTSMPCPCWEGSKVPVNEKGEEESIPWGNSEVSITDIGNIVKIDKDTLLKLIKNSEKLSTLEEWGVDNWINYGEAMQYLDDSPDEVLLKQYLVIDFETKKVLFIDLDSTLIKTISGKTFPEDITDFRVQLPVLDKIIEKMPNLSMFFIVSNQGGLKTLTDKRIFNYKIWAVEDICYGYFINKLNNFSYSDSLYCCSMDKNNTYRKPNTGMLEQLYYQYKVESKDECIMIGDASGKSGDFSDSDKRCASRFFIDYIDVRDFLEL